MRLHFTLFLFLIVTFTQSQNNISIKITSLSYQFTETQADIIKMKLSNNGQLAFEPGLILGYEGFASPSTALKFSQFVLLDKAMHIAGSTQLMLKIKLIKSFKNSIYFAVGPGLFYRQSWSNIEDYADESIYNESSGWQYKFSWFSGEIEYNYYLSKYSDITISINHTQAESIGIAFGLKYWINKNPGKKHGCVSCPGLH